MTDEYLDARDSITRQATREGKEAAGRGAVEKSNPYHRRNEKVAHDAWRDGFRDAYWKIKLAKDAEAA